MSYKFLFFITAVIANPAKASAGLLTSKIPTSRKEALSMGGFAGRSDKTGSDEASEMGLDEIDEMVDEVVVELLSNRIE